jgi:putative phosphoribosyl transferase
MYQQKLKIPIDDFFLNAQLSVPVQSKSLIVFVHGHGHHRSISINDFVARHAQQVGFATLLVDLLASETDEPHHPVEDPSYLSNRLTLVVLWLQNHAEYNHFKLAIFASGSGANIALPVAFNVGTLLETVVCAGGSPDFIRTNVSDHTCPLFFIFGERDSRLEGIRKQLQQSIDSPHKMVVVPGSGALFEETGKLAILAKYALSWFVKYLPEGKREISLAGDITEHDISITK